MFFKFCRKVITELLGGLVQSFRLQVTGSKIQVPASKLRELPLET
jgi:hypothetical protein